jgi:hypothetical protein
MSELVETLKKTVEKLEQRIEDLESRIQGGHGGAASQKAGAESIRMILIGPPGAGMYHSSSRRRTRISSDAKDWSLTIPLRRQGNSSP